MSFSGKKNWIVAIVVAIAGLVKLTTGHDLSEWVTAFFASIGWSQELTDPLVDRVGDIALTLFALYAAVRGLRKFLLEKKAGASSAEALTQVGAVKLAMATGVIPPAAILPAAVATPPPPVVLERIKVLNRDVEKKKG